MIPMLLTFFAVSGTAMNGTSVILTFISFASLAQSSQLYLSDLHGGTVVEGQKEKLFLVSLNSSWKGNFPAWMGKIEVTDHA